MDKPYVLRNKNPLREQADDDEDDDGDDEV